MGASTSCRSTTAWRSGPRASASFPWRGSAASGSSRPGPFPGGNLFQATRGRELPAWASEFDCTSWAQFFLKYIASHPAVTCSIPATSNPDPMRDNMGAGVGRLPDDEIRRRMEAFMDAL